MRTIRFRGKSITKFGKVINIGDWIYGGISMDYDRVWIDTEYYGQIIVDKETVGQFTGLYDKNGKEIYEGDIAKYGNTIGKIMFLEGCFVLSDFEEQEEWTLAYISDEIEVVGNIYDNKKFIRRVIKHE